MNVRATILVGLLGAPLFAGAPLAAETGNLSLVDAARQGDREAVRALLNSRAKADVAEADGTTALIWAASRNDLEMADLLLRAGRCRPAGKDRSRKAVPGRVASAREVVDAPRWRPRFDVRAPKDVEDGPCEVVRRCVLAHHAGGDHEDFPAAQFHVPGLAFFQDDQL